MALLLPNSPQTLVCQFGVWKAGAIAAPMNPLYTEDELEHALQVSGATAAVVLTPFYPKVKAIQPRTSLRFVIATNIKEYLSPVLRLLFTVAKEKKEGHRITLQAGDYRLQELLQQYAHARRPACGSTPAIRPCCCLPAARRARPRRRSARTGRW